MKKIDLLPHHIQQYKRARKLKIFLVALQVTIFLCIGIVIVVLNAQEQFFSNRLRALTAQISGFDDRPLLIMAELDDAITLARNFDEFYAASFPIQFDTLWFEVILQNLPENTVLSRLSYRQMEILIEGEVSDILDIEIYRQALVDVNLFENVRFGNRDLLSSGRFSFELRVGVRQNE